MEQNYIRKSLSAISSPKSKQASEYIHMFSQDNQVPQNHLRVLKRKSIQNQELVWNLARIKKDLNSHRKFVNKSAIYFRKNSNDNHSQQLLELKNEQSNSQKNSQIPSINDFNNGWSKFQIQTDTQNLINDNNNNNYSTQYSMGSQNNLRQSQNGNKRLQKMKWNFIKDTPIDKHLQQLSQSVLRSKSQMQENLSKDQFDKEIDDFDYLADEVIHNQQSITIFNDDEEEVDSPRKVLEKQKEKVEEDQEVNMQKVSRIKVKESKIPLEALYNQKIETLKKVEYVSDIAPQPLTICILNSYDGNPNNTMVRIQNEDLNIMLEHKYKEDYKKKVHASYKEIEARKKKIYSQMDLSLIDQRRWGKRFGKDVLKHLDIINNIDGHNMNLVMKKDLSISKRNRDEFSKQMRKLRKRKSFIVPESKFQSSKLTAMFDYDGEEESRLVEVVREFIQQKQALKFKHQQDDPQVIESIKADLAKKFQFQPIKPNLEYIINKKLTSASDFEEFKDFKQEVKGSKLIVKDQEEFQRFMKHKNYGRYYVKTDRWNELESRINSQSCFTYRRTNFDLDDSFEELAQKKNELQVKSSKKLKRLNTIRKGYKQYEVNKSAQLSPMNNHFKDIKQIKNQIQNSTSISQKKFRHVIKHQSAYDKSILTSMIKHQEENFKLSNEQELMIKKKVAMFSENLGSILKQEKS